MTKKITLLTLFGEPTQSDDEKCRPGGAKPTAQTQNAEKSADVDKAARFEALIKGEFKDIYEARIGEIIKKRLKNAGAAAERLETIRPALNLLFAKYEVAPDDFDGFRDAVLKNDFEADKTAPGSPAPINEKDAETSAKIDMDALEQKAEALYRHWMEEAEAIKKDYPDFSLEDEIRGSARLAELLRAGIDLRTCYEVLHKDDILQKSAEMIEEKLANTLLSNGARPRENGISSPVSTLLRQDVSNLTKAERADIIRRVARGEIIRF